MFIELVAGGLPWGEAARGKDKPAVLAIKQEYRADPGKFADWISSSAAGKPVPEAVSSCLCSVIELLSGLQYEDSPPYADLFAAFRGMMGGLDVGSPDFTLGPFSWADGADKTVVAWREGKVRVSQSQALQHRAKALEHHVAEFFKRTKIDACAPSASVSPDDTEEEMRLAMQWKRFALEVMKIPIEKLSYDTVDRFSRILALSENFYLCAIEPSTSTSWAEYEAVQRTIADLARLKRQVYASGAGFNKPRSNMGSPRGGVGSPRGGMGSPREGPSEKRSKLS